MRPTDSQQVVPISLISSARNKLMTTIKPVFHFARTVSKRTGEHAKIEKRFINPRTSGCIRRLFAYENEKFVASQLFGVLRKY